MKEEGSESRSGKEGRQRRGLSGCQGVSIASDPGPPSACLQAPVCLHCEPVCVWMGAMKTGWE